jgi:hypothetical protein
MKIRIITSLCLLALSLCAYCQQISELQAPKRFISRIECSVGMTLSIPYGSYFTAKPEVVIPKLGYAFGLSASHDFARIISVDVAVLYEVKNYSTSQDVFWASLNPPQNSTTLIENELKYLNLYAVTNFRLGNSSKFFLGAGGYYGFLRGGGTSETSTYSGGNKTFFYTSSTSWLENSDHGLILSLKYRHPISERYDIHIQLLNALGLYDITTNPLPLVVIRNNTYSLMIGITLKK